jgi:KilA-N domain
MYKPKLTSDINKYTNHFQKHSFKINQLATMNFVQTSPEDFSIVKNAIDERLEIIRHNDTGYYNITKMANLVNSVKQPAGFPAGSNKPARNWFINDSTQELFEACKECIQETKVYYELAAGTPKRFAGTYVHRFLFDHFMMWLDKKYAMKVSFILDHMHQDANRKIIKEKDDKIDELSHKIDELLGYAKSTTEKLDEVKDELIETKEEVILSKTYLEEKSFHSTMNPSNDSLHHAVAATKYDNKNEKCVKVITGQRKYVDKTVQKNLDNGHTLAIDTFYNANGIDLRQNTCDAFKRKRKEVVIAYNAKQVAEAKAFNSKLRKEINAYNKKNPDTQRIYVKEKMTPQKISIGDITVKFSKLAFSYTENPYMSFDEVLQIIIDTNQATQVSPLASSDSE